MRINHNIAALNTSRQLNAGSNSAAKNMEKLSSGLRINRAGDDAAGLAISEKMRSQIRGLDMASKNAQDGISLIQTAEGALNETHSILQRMSELATQAANDTNTTSDRDELQKEMDQLSSEVTRISTDTEFNTKKLLDGTADKLTFQIGANEGQTMSLSINNMNADSLKVIGQVGEKIGLDGNSELEVRNDQGEAVKISFTAAGTSDVDKTTASYDETSKTVTVTLAQKADGTITASQEDVLNSLNKTGAVKATAIDGADLTKKATVGGDTTTSTTVNKDATKGIDISSSAKAASSALTTIKTAIDTVSSERAKLGAVQNRLEHTINNLGTSSENLTSAESRIRDVDMASEMMQYTKNNILTQASQAMLAQANQQPQQVLQLLKG
ncbi:flagellin [Bacillus velezensis]|uniref:flagellin N-terminal helical domain-containing protein n=1 Tax=Bacillus TaxID=1386 RepID=UPI0006AEB294|nr:MULTISPECIES: flagellin [Bacillus]AMQ69259.1 flagellin [Bacillus amyloliquefaciens UMAF6639]AQP96767.1 flagellin [Bacillus sp. 275]AWD89321.1 flagellin [Bacillus velezensis]AWM53235.1 flagellin [Bacillus amyloliquefaciens]KAF6696480.1 flagellin [Bacillus sp. EKM601B]|eukprot:TRINITY_DN25404_c0_g1_i1.p1 TRINITY_DN25404_c0_g1~~TRINITY_DN25404_c0_g1_i1.p1  ORF type:complete len:385 (+),score=-65.20 TRINITY_DN25404_c0_g1_i1:77-1231(+)